MQHQPIYTAFGVTPPLQLFLLFAFSDMKASGDTLWSTTLYYNFLRSFGSGVVWAVVSLFNNGMDLGVPAVLFPFVMGIGFVLCFYPILKLIMVVMPFNEALSPIFALLFVTPGDPLVKLLYKLYPKAVPIEDPPVFSLKLFYMVKQA